MKYCKRTQRALVLFNRAQKRLALKQNTENTKQKMWTCSHSVCTVVCVIIAKWIEKSFKFWQHVVQYSKDDQRAKHVALVSL